MPSCQTFNCTNENGKCEDSLFCNYQFYPCQHINHCPRKRTCMHKTS